MKNKSFYVVLPAFNEEENLGQLIRRIKKTTSNLIVVNDGSTDRTGEIIKQHQLINVSHELNLGKGAAMKTGAELAFKLGVNRVVFMDADGQHDPSDIPRFLSKLDQGYDYVFGSRSGSGQIPWVRKILNQVLVLIIKKTFGVNRADPLCGYMAMSKKGYREIKWEASDYGVETEITARLRKSRLSYTEIPIQSVYNNKNNAMTMIDALIIILNIPRWKFI